MATCLADKPDYFNLSNNFRLHPMGEFNCHADNLDISQWEKANKKLAPGREYCLRFNLQLKASDIPENPALFLSSLSASEIYWDGQALTSNGTPGDSKKAEQPGNIHFFYPLQNLENLSGSHTISMRLSTHFLQKPLHQSFYSFALVNETVMRKELQTNYLIPLVLAGFLFCVSLIFYLIYLLYRRQEQSLWFSVLAFLSSALLVVEKLREIFGYSYDWHIPRLNAVLLLSTLVATALVGFYLSYFQIQQKYKWFVGLLLLSVLTWILPIGYDPRSLIVFGLALLGCLSITLLQFKTHKREATLNTAFLSVAISLFIYWNLRFVEYGFAAIIALLIVFHLIVMIRQFAIDRTRALEAEKMELELLKRSLQPHFLMNSLTLVMEWIETQPEKALDFIQALSKEFKLFTQFSQKRCVSLAEEIEFCQNYLAIMSSRLQVDCSLTIAGNNYAIELPPAIIHTLLENSFTHCGQQNSFEFHLTITESENSTTLLLASPLGTRVASGTGLGSRYIRTQLKRLFDDNWQFNSYQKKQLWFDEIRVRSIQ